MNTTDSVDTLELIEDSFEIQNKKNDEIVENQNQNSQSLNKIYFNEDESINSLNLDQDLLDENIKSSTNESVKMDMGLYKNEFEEMINQLDNKDESNDIENVIETSDLQHLDLKLKEAWIKMRKLDKILEKVCLKEKQVKIETQQLISRNRQELELIRLNSEHKESKSEAENTAHFLSLSYINIDDEIIKDLNFNNEPSTPVFKTQLPDTDRDTINESSLSNRSKIKENQKVLNKNSIKSSNTLSSNTNRANNSKKKNSSDLSDVHDKNFIKRNIQLAKDIGGVLSMTDEEKLRLNQLMIDIDEFDQNKTDKNITGEDDSQEKDHTIIAEYNPYAVKLSEGDGFVPNNVETTRLKQIDLILEKKNTERSSSSRIFASSYFMSKSKLSNESVAPQDIFEYQIKQIKLNDEFDENEFGDKFIREGRITREQEQRLKLIDAHLKQFKVTDNQSEILSQSSSTNTGSVSKIPLIDENTLKELLNECASEHLHIEDFERQKTLDTLVEEKSENELDSKYFTKSQVRLDELTIKSLIDQAKTEGILVDIDEPNELKQDSENMSYYEEALSVVNNSARKTLFELNNELFETIYSFSNDDNDNINNFIRKNSHDSNNDENINPNYNNQDKKKMFPSILSNDDERNEDGRNSSLSNFSINSSTTSLPKIESRFLPKQK